MGLLPCAVLLGLPVSAAYISEIDLGGPTSPAGQGIELSQFDSAHTLLIMEAGATSSMFGLVLDVIHLPASIGRADVAMITDVAWPDNTAVTTPLASLSPAPINATLPLSNTRLLIVMQGQSDVRWLDNPLSTDAAAAARYDKNAVTDWLVLTQGESAATFQTNQDVATIDATLGIDLLSRLVDKGAGRVIGRTVMQDAAPGTGVDMDTFYVGTPDDTTRQFDVPGGYHYTYTPSMANLPLSNLPEPNTLAIFALAAGLVLRRSR